MQRLLFQNSVFKIVESEHNNASPQNAWTSLGNDNLVRVKNDEEIEAKNTEKIKNRLNKVIYSTPGGEIDRLSMKGKVVGRNNTMTHSITSGNQLQYKYAIGAIVKK